MNHWNESGKIIHSLINRIGFPRTGLFLLIFLKLAACSDEPDSRSTNKSPTPEKNQQVIQQQSYSCRDCHAYKLNPSHDTMGCTSCHQGKNPASSRQAAHHNLIDQPAHPDNMVKNCAGCHPDQVKAAGASVHFTLAKKINTVRQAFAANESLASLKEIPIVNAPATPLELADDLLRRRCLHCHVYWPGDLYAETIHGTGCAACHLAYGEGTLQSHKFLGLPRDRQCLHCHYGNHVGGDYYGLYEHDFHWAYRTPYQKNGLTPDRPYGVENHRLSPDIHQKAGLACIDCHSGMELMSADPALKINCLTCHQRKKEKIKVRKNLDLKNGRLLMTTVISEKTLKVPPLEDPAHKWAVNRPPYHNSASATTKHRKKISCQVCHSKWVYNDIGTHLIRLDIQNYEPWANLDVQSNFEAEAEITDFLYGEKEYPYPFMQDKITGRSSRGLWLKGFELRRWENPVYCRDKQGILRVCRPILNLHLTWVNKKGKVVFDAVTPDRTAPGGLLPYTPHTIGRAGPFFRQRLQENGNLLRKPYFLKEKPKGEEPEMQP
ncbi:MAG: hypothetical protein R6V20_07355 [Desulfobia sp.]